ncbi:MAG: hypothetical protein DRN19_06165 [Thermoplasmata archaeon]|nr:MAG: hypothetical protein DRN19_06165 [Thermoplasmata archaeon]
MVLVCRSIFSNFISGIILLLERSLKIGDLVELEDGAPWVVKNIVMLQPLLELLTVMM